MKTKIGYLLAAVLLSTAAGVQAQGNSPERPSRDEMREKFRNMTPEERQKAVQEWRSKQDAGAPPGADRRREAMEEASKQLGINPEEMRNLTPDERRAKFNEAADKKITELKKKQEDQSITEDEKKLLQRLEMRKKYAEQHKDGPPRREGPPHRDDPSKDGAKDGKGKKPEDKKGDKPAPKK